MGTPAYGSHVGGPTAAPPATVGEDDAPLTDVQREIVGKVADAQDQLGRAERWRRGASSGGLFTGGWGGGLLASGIDSLLATHAEAQVDALDGEAQHLADLAAVGIGDGGGGSRSGGGGGSGSGKSLPGTAAVPRVPAGGPPTPEEVREAELHPWPRHGMAETIERNRGLRMAAGGTGTPSDPSGAPSGTG